MIPDLSEWLAYIPDKTACKSNAWQEWFKAIFAELAERGFEFKGSERDIADGFDLVFSNGEATVYASRIGHAAIMNYVPSVTFTDSAECWEVVFTVTSPIKAVKKLIEEILPEERYE